MGSQGSSGHTANNNDTRSVLGGFNKILVLILTSSLGLNAIYMMNGLPQKIQQSMLYEMPLIEEDYSSTPSGLSFTGEPPSDDDQTLEPIRFIAVGGPYHTGSTVRLFTHVLQLL
jgi:hypothetical protein